MIGSYSMSWLNFLTYLILIHQGIPVEYKLMTCLPRTFPVFSCFSFKSLCLYSAYVLLIVSSLVLSTLSYAHLCPNLPLSMRLFKHSRFLCSSTLSFGVSIISPKTHHCLIHLQHRSLLLLRVEITTI